MNAPEADKKNIFLVCQILQAILGWEPDDSDSDLSVDQEDEEYESDLSEDEHAEDTVINSMDTEMQRCMTTMFISSDTDRECLITLS